MLMNKNHFLTFPNEGKIMIIMSKLDEITIIKTSAILNITYPQTSILFKRLQKMGYADMRMGKANKLFFLTKKGRSLSIYLKELARTIRYPTSLNSNDINLREKEILEKIMSQKRYKRYSNPEYYHKYYSTERGKTIILNAIHRRKAIMNKIKSSLTKEQLQKKREQKKCAYCGLKKKLTIEHITPVSKKGEHSEENITMVCKSCNSSKGNKRIIDWLRTTYCRTNNITLDRINEVVKI